MVLVNLAAATICFTGTCYPALVGEGTPTGTFPLSRQATIEPGFGGDILVFKENRQYVWAIHRVYTLNAGENRVERLNASLPGQRRGITKGCINVMPEVYLKLAKCCSKDVVLIY